MLTPRPVGPLSGWVHGVLVGADPAPAPEVASDDPVLDRDLQLALWTLYELHYGGFDDADPDADWDPTLIAFRRQLERLFEASVRERTASVMPTEAPATDIEGVVAQLTQVIDAVTGPDLTGHLQRRADLAQFTEFMRLRSIYHLKESDPQSFVLPRVRGGAKVALAELQYDEFGAGRPEMLHQRLFAGALEACGLEADYGVYIDEADASTLAVNNVMSLFALNRRLRGASLGHLAAFEATSSIPCRRIAQGTRRLGLPDAAAAYWDEHVEADAAHEQVALRDICGRVVSDEPALAGDVLMGAAACAVLDAVAAQELLGRWDALDESRGAA
ncbi:iron-containing redox enzyme family protein [Nocardioides sp. Y6]|uniref:Iron-containing redox enzyme family protein n=1 Tax=Nocardioides malaquae TaxID=2773426 RepID=A0ABR9RW18_9ACTN|nr:iron-containing redox enzyme family protein [Nocardioides malaquae]MBE7325726.1 iron-containing redox enzyme family protein [Nocardioides malaquae]